LNCAKIKAYMVEQGRAPQPKHGDGPKKSSPWKDATITVFDRIFPHLEAVPLKKDFYYPKNPVLAKIAEGLSIWGAPDIRVSGKENIEDAIKISKGKNMAFVMRHISHFDTPAVERALRKLGFGEIVDKLIFLQGTKLDKTPIASNFLWSFNRIKVWPPGVPADSEKEKIERWKMTEESLNSTKKALEKGYSIGIYCEGGRSYDGTLKPAEPAAIHYLTLQPDTIAIPVTIRRTNGVLPRGSWLIFPAAPVDVNFGEPINITSLMEEYKHVPRHHERYRKIGDYIMRKIAQKLPEKFRGVYANKN
jgi:1-acyl-sn-glycerol-3-phosphate acyltransferase